MRSDRQTLDIPQSIKTAVGHHQAGRLAEAERIYEQVLKIDPGNPAALHMLGVVAHQVGRHEASVQLIDKAIAIKPEFVEALSNRGLALQSLKRYEEALASHDKALAIKPDFAEALNNLGFALQELKRYEEALASCDRALAIKPDYAEALNNRGNALKELKRHEEALASYRMAVSIRPDYAEAHCNLAVALQDQGRLADALPHFQDALKIKPGLLRAQGGMSSALRQLVPHWHVPMMNDAIRNEAYFAALKTAITPEANVLEIGTGSGLLAMMAATLGAKKVTTCEVAPLIASTARSIIFDNGLGNAIDVIPKRSSDIALGLDMPRKADILVAEIFSSALLGEDVLVTMEDAKHRLLQPGGRIIPASASIMIALVGGDSLEKNLAVEQSHGFNLRRFNTLVPALQFVHRSDLDPQLFSPDIEAFTFDFQKDSLFPEQVKTLRIPVATAGRCYGVIQWIRLQMDKDIVFANHPSVKATTSGWQHCVYLFPAPVELRAGQAAVVAAMHDRRIPWFLLHGIEG